MNISLYTINAFAKNSGGGNPAGIVLDADAFSDAQMQQIAAAVGFSETAFVLNSDVADKRVRFFTPSGEVNLCGHATIGLFSFLVQKDILKPGCYTQETKAGILPVELNGNGTVMMSQNLPEFSDIVDMGEIAESLGVLADPDRVFMKDFPAQIASTGLRDILVPVNNLAQLKCLRPDLNRITAVSKRYNVVGYHVFTLETMHNATAHCRNFAPLYDIPEEAATGTSSGALCCYLNRYQLCNSDEMIFEQGYTLDRPSEILAKINCANGAITEIKVGGTALDMKMIEIMI